MIPSIITVILFTTGLLISRRANEATPYPSVDDGLILVLLWIFLLIIDLIVWLIWSLHK